MQPASAIEQWQNILTKNGSIIPSATEFYRIGGKFIHVRFQKQNFYLQCSSLLFKIYDNSQANN